MNILNDKSIVTFAGKDRDHLAVVLGLDQIMRGSKAPHGAVFEFDEEVAKEFQFFELALISLAYLEDDTETIVALEEFGEVRLLRNGEIATERFEPSRGPMRVIKRIGDSLFAAGVSAQVYRREPSGHWTDIGPPQSERDALRLSMIEDLDGFSEKDIYAAADNGVIWHYDGTSWTAIETATNLAFHCVTCADDGLVYASGQLGILARGSGKEFDIVAQDDDFADIWGIARYEGHLYLSSMRALLTLNADDVFEPVIPAMELGFTFYGLQITDGVLWSVGEKDILKLDRDSWSRFVDPKWVQ